MGGGRGGGMGGGRGAGMGGGRGAGMGGGRGAGMGGGRGAGMGGGGGAGMGGGRGAGMGGGGGGSGRWSAWCRGWGLPAGASNPFGAPADPMSQGATADDLGILKAQAQELGAQLDRIRQRIEEIEKSEDQ